MDSNNNNSTSNNSCSSSSSSIKVQSPLLSTSSSSTNVSAPHVSIAVVDDDTVSAAVSAASVSPPLACTSTTISSPLMSLDMCPCPPPPPPPPLADADSDADADAKVCVATAMVLDPSPCLPSCPLASMQVDSDSPSPSHSHSPPSSTCPSPSHQIIEIQPIISKTFNDLNRKCLLSIIQNIEDDVDMLSLLFTCKKMLHLVSLGVTSAPSSGPLVQLKQVYLINTEDGFRRDIVSKRMTRNMSLLALRSFKWQWDHAVGFDLVMDQDYITKLSLQTGVKDFLKAPTDTCKLGICLGNMSHHVVPYSTKSLMVSLCHRDFSRLKGLETLVQKHCKSMGLSKKAPLPESLTKLYMCHGSFEYASLPRGLRELNLYPADETLASTLTELDLGALTELTSMSLNHVHLNTRTGMNTFMRSLAAGNKTMPTNLRFPPNLLRLSAMSSVLHVDALPTTLVSLHINWAISNTEPAWCNLTKLVSLETAQFSGVPMETLNRMTFPRTLRSLTLLNCQQPNRAIRFAPPAALEKLIVEPFTLVSSVPASVTNLLLKGKGERMPAEFIPRTVTKLSLLWVDEDKLQNVIPSSVRDLKTDYLLKPVFLPPLPLLSYEIYCLQPFASAPYADNRTSQSITTLHLRGSVPGATRSISQLFQANSIPRSVTHLKIKLDVPSPSLRFSFRLTEIFARSNITRISVELVSDAKIKDGKVSTYHIRRDPNTSSKHVFVVEQNSLYGGFIDITNPAITHYLNVKKSGPFISTNSICTTSSSSSSRSTKRK